MNNLYAYKMTWATGFAPNPEKGFLSLATCKPVIRRSAQVGDWLSGWTAKEVHLRGGAKLKFPEQKLVYLAKVAEKITMAEYWDRYPEKRPGSCEWGDNIYRPLVDGAVAVGDFEQVTNADHRSGDVARDLSGKNVLICREFYYFGAENALEVPADVFPYAVPRCKKIPLGDVEGFLAFVEEKANRKNGIVE